jgi:hypothetical protein
VLCGKHIALLEVAECRHSWSSAYPNWGGSQARKSTRVGGVINPLRSPMLRTHGVARARCGGAPSTSARQDLVGGVRRRTLLTRQRVRRNYCGEMRLRSDTAASTASLADYLRRCGCIVEVIDRRIMDAAARPQSFAAPHAHVELEGYLSVWQAMHPEALIERLGPLTPTQGVQGQP